MCGRQSLVGGRRDGVPRSHRLRAIAVDVTGVEATTLIKGSRLDLADSALPSVGRRGLLIHAESEAAREFYLHLIPELETSRTDDLHLVLFMKDARKVLAG